jgi:hypothetical protein
VPFENTNHFLPKVFSLWIAKDKWYATYSGRVAYTKFNGGAGAFKKDKYAVDQDPFAYTIGLAGKKKDENVDVPVDELRA